MAGSLRGFTLFPLPSPFTFIIWEKDRSGLDHLGRTGRFLQCLMEHSENHSNVSSSWWHPIAPITCKTHEGIPLPSVNELLYCITPWKLEKQSHHLWSEHIQKSQTENCVGDSDSCGIGSLRDLVIDLILTKKLKI